MGATLAQCSIVQSCHAVPDPSVEVFGDDAWLTGAHGLDVNTVNPLCTCTNKKFRTFVFELLRVFIFYLRM